ncbi:MAG: protease complex subunit PrcB family protein [Patescibacteria group bacterium]|nr:protease complex subunit PrcB family protein [Patescibacteria group bacterium]MDE1966324.1 protease complex subunit PrcB family protein [Patescibacteria group bacterium]
MKDILIILGLCLAAILIGAWLFLANPKSAASPASTVTAVTVPVPVTELGAGTVTATATSKVNYRIQDSAALAKLWSMAYGASTTPPAVDFSTDDVVAVFAGPEPTTGYAIAVTRVEDAADGRLITIALSKPDSSCIEADTVTSPYEIVTMPKTALPLAHAYEFATSTCAR